MAVSFSEVFFGIGVLQNLLCCMTSCISFLAFFRFFDLSIIGSSGDTRGGETSTRKYVYDSENNWKSLYLPIASIWPAVVFCLSSHPAVLKGFVGLGYFKVSLRRIIGLSEDSYV